MPILAKGSFGCVYSPSLRCELPPSANFNYENKISKIGKNDIIDEEFKKYRFIELADEKSKYYLGKPIKCKPDPNIHKFELFNPSNKFKNCPFFTDEQSINLNDYSLLILDSGGITLRDFIDDINSKYNIKKQKDTIFLKRKMLLDEFNELQERINADVKIKPTIKQKILQPYANEINTLGKEFNQLIKIKSEKDITIYKQELVTSFENFLIDVYKLFHGIEAFLKSRVIHFDIKFNNIVYDWKLRHMSYIDFGEMRPIPKIIKESKSPENQVDYKEKSMWYRPPEIRLYNINEFQKVTKNKENKKNELENVINRATGDILEYKKRSNLENISYEDIYYQYKAMLETLDETKYDKLLEKSLQKFDSYGLGATLFKLIHELDNQIPIDENLLNDIIKLSKQMINWNVFERITIKEAMIEYKTILHNYGLNIIETDNEDKITTSQTIAGGKSKKQTKRVNKKRQIVKQKSYRKTAKCK